MRKIGVTLLVVLLVVSTLNITLPPPTADAWRSTAIYSYGTTRIADNGTWKGLQAANDASAPGDLVLIPDGVWDYSPSPTFHRLNLTAGVSLGSYNYTVSCATGIPTSHSAVLNISWEVPGSNWLNNSDPDPKDWIYVDGNAAPDENTRIFGFKMVGYRSTDPTIHNFTHGIYMLGMLDFRVDHMTLENIGGQAIKSKGLFGVGNFPQNASGLIDHNNFTNNPFWQQSDYSWFYCDSQYGVSVIRENAGDLWDSNILNVYGKYTNYTVCIENNFFSGWRHEIVANGGGHYISRFNVVNWTTGIGQFDLHGGATMTGPVFDSVCARAAEIYNNTVAFTAESCALSWMNHQRGGAVMAFYNTFGDLSTNWDYMHHFQNDMRALGAPAAKLMCNDTYIWNNTIIGGAALTAEFDPEGWITEGVNYWLFEPNGTGTVPAYTPYRYPHELYYDGGGIISEKDNPGSVNSVPDIKINKINGVG